MNGINFGGEGPIMQGTWYNPHTGDAFTVRDSFFEDNQYIVMTTDGRKLDYNRLQNYVQSDMKLEDLKKMRVEKEEKEEIPSEIKNLIADDTEDYLIPEDNIFGGGLGNIHQPRHIAPASVHQGGVNMPINMNNAIIEKALRGAKKPEFVVTVKWKDFPNKQIEMLRDVMEIPDNEILDWYLDNIDMLEISEAVKNGISNHINSHTQVQMIVEGAPTPLIDVKKSVKGVKKPTSKKAQPKKS